MLPLALTLLVPLGALVTTHFFVKVCILGIYTRETLVLDKPTATHAHRQAVKNMLISLVVTVFLVEVFNLATPSDEVLLSSTFLHVHYYLDAALTVSLAITCWCNGKRTPSLHWVLAYLSTSLFSLVAITGLILYIQRLYLYWQ